MTTKPNIAIVGGGPGGLMLARLLFLRGFKPAVFERDRQADDRPQGGSLDLHGETGQREPHGLTQILYAFTSAAGNNGSAFGGLTVNTLWYDGAIGITMLVGRFLMIIPMLAIAGNLAQKKYVPPSLGTFPVTTPLFTMLLISVILILGALTFFPALSLGPILEHLLMHVGKTF